MEYNEIQFYCTHKNDYHLIIFENLYMKYKTIICIIIVSIVFIKYNILVNPFFFYLSHNYCIFIFYKKKKKIKKIFFF